jgi:hypothetical protein
MIDDDGTERGLTRCLAAEDIEGMIDIEWAQGWE